MSRKRIPSIATLNAVAEGACSECPGLLRVIAPRDAPSFVSTLKLYSWATGLPHVLVRGLRTGRVDVLPVGDAERWRDACEYEASAPTRLEPTG